MHTCIIKCALATFCTVVNAHLQYKVCTGHFLYSGQCTPALQSVHWPLHRWWTLNSQHTWQCFHCQCVQHTTWCTVHTRWKKYSTPPTIRCAPTTRHNCVLPTSFLRVFKQEKPDMLHDYGPDFDIDSHSPPPVNEVGSECILCDLHCKGSKASELEVAALREKLKEK